MSYYQLLIYIIYVILGIIMSIEFDFFKTIRSLIKHNFLFIVIEDIIFFSLSVFELSFVYFYYSYGIIRLYMIVGLINGFMIYYLIYRKFFRKMK